MALAIIGACLILIAMVAIAVVIVIAIVNAIRHRKARYALPILLCVIAFLTGFIMIGMSSDTITKMQEASPAEQTVAAQETTEATSEPLEERDDASDTDESVIDAIKNLFSSPSESNDAQSESSAAETTIVTASEPDSIAAEATVDQETATSESTEEAGEEEEPVDTSVTFADIYREFDANEIRAKERYNGHRYQITGTINGISSGGLIHLMGGATLTMENRVDNTIVYYYAEFGRDQEEALKNVNTGDTITFIGECWGGTFTDCVLQ